MRLLNGVVPVLLTPMTNKHCVDVPSLEKLCELLLTKPIGGLWVLGTGAEDMSLSYSQRLVVAETVAKVNNGRVPLVVGCSFFSMTESLSFLDDTQHLNIDAYHAMPYHPLLSLERLKSWYENIALNAAFPLWMYTSANWARYIPPEFVKELSTNEKIVGVKYSTSNAVHMEQVAALANSEFQVLSAVVKTFYSNLCLGVKGGTTVEACAFINPIVDIYEAFQSNNLSLALSYQNKLNRFFEQMPVAPGADNFLRVAESKYILSRQGICSETMSGYYRELYTDEKQLICRLLDEHDWMIKGFN